MSKPYLWNFTVLPALISEFYNLSNSDRISHSRRIRIASMSNRFILLYFRAMGEVYLYIGITSLCL